MGHYFGRKGEIIGQILVNICLQANNMASIIIAAQVAYAVRILIPGNGRLYDLPFWSHLWSTLRASVCPIHSAYQLTM